MERCEYCEKVMQEDEGVFSHQAGSLLLCDDCAPSFGICPGCARVAAGADDDHLARYGLCYECWQELRAETGEFDVEE